MTVPSLRLSTLLLSLAALSAALAIAAPSADARSHSQTHCQVCRFVVHAVISHLDHHNHPGETNAQRVVEHACRWVPDGYRHVCHEVIERHGHDLVQLALRGELGHHACAQLDACDGRHERAAGAAGC